MQETFLCNGKDNYSYILHETFEDVNDNILYKI